MFWIVASKDFKEFTFDKEIKVISYVKIWWLIVNILIFYKLNDWISFGEVL